MSEQLERVESACDEATQKTAEQQGWIPATRYRGEAEHFVDADEFIKRGETVLPIVKKQLASTRAELAAVTRQAAETQTALARANKAIDDINERHTVETQKAVDRAIAGVKAQIVAASEANDHEAVAELTDSLIELRKEPPVVEKKEAAAATVVEQPILPEIKEAFDSWRADNPIFDKDPDYKAFIFAAGERLRREGDRTVGRAFFDKCQEIVDKKFKREEPPAQEDRTDGGRHGEGASRAGGKKSFASLPADAKKACKDMERGRVGKGMRYETAAAWQAEYARIYYKDEE